MKTNKYSTIVFDLGNTLIRFDHNIAVKKLQVRYDIDPKKTYDLFFDSEITRLFEIGQISPGEFHRRASLLLGIDVEYSEFLEIWNNIFWEDEGSCALARKLKSNYKLFLLSNINKVHFEHVRAKFDILDIFDEMILSYRLGAMKPDKRIYDDVVRKAGGDRSKLIYIDDREDLIKVSTALGIDSIKYEGAEKLTLAFRDKGII
jgi:glucose-1-phosphatase